MPVAEAQEEFCVCDPPVPTVSGFCSNCGLKIPPPDALEGFDNDQPYERRDF